MRQGPEREPTEKEHGAHTLKVWQGTVVGVNGDDVFVELGPRMQGVISKRQFDAVPDMGAAFEFTLRGQEEGLWALALAERPSLSTWENMEVASLVHARVIRLAPGGLELKIGPLHAFMPKSHSGLPREQALDVLVGKTLTCEVIEVDKLRQRVLVSRKLVQKRERESERQRIVGSLKPGEVVQGRVTRVEPYGAFVTFGHGMEGMIHVSNLAYERVEHPEQVVHMGQTLELKVLAVKHSGKRIALGLKQMHTSPWKGLEREYGVDQIVEGVVTRVMDHAAFVSVRRGVEGFLSIAQVALDRGMPLCSLLSAGQRISVRIVDLDSERERMSLSLLHRNGTRIAADEAPNRASFLELTGTDGPGALHVKLGKLLGRGNHEHERRG